MNKIRVEFKEREWKKIDKWGFSVKPFISDVDQRAIVQVYLNDLFAEIGDVHNNYIRAENGLIASILELNTDLMVVNDDDPSRTPEIVVSMDKIFENYDMYQAVENSIINIGEFKRRLLKTVEARREEIRIKNSLGFVLDDLYKKGTDYITKILETDFSVEQLDKIKETLKEANASPILKSLTEQLK